MLLSIISSQVDADDDRKRKYTGVYADVADRKRYNYDRLRAVKHPFYRDRITVVCGRVVNDRTRTSFTTKYVPCHGRIQRGATVYNKVYDRLST